MANFLKRMYGILSKTNPTLYYIIKYNLAAKKLGNPAKESRALFSEFIKTHEDKECLQIGVKEQRKAKFGTNWVSVDKYDHRSFIDYNYDIHDLKFNDETFDAVACLSILEHIPYPVKAIQEMHRVLKPKGKIWVQLPFQYPYHEGPKDFWRASPDGLRIWMEQFNEISCGCYKWTKSSLVTTTYFYGEKK